MVTDSWFHSLWKPSKKHEHGPEKVRIGVLVFEVASVMSKLVHQWNILTDKQVMKIRDEISNSLGIKKLISDDDDCIVDLICAEMLHNLDNVARIVTRLSRKCRDPVLKCFERAYTDLVKHGVDQYQWQFTDKKMSGKLKKMESFISVNASLYQEMESLVELEQILKRIKSNDDHDSITVVEYTKKMSWKQQEVKRLKGISLWNKTYDYVVLLLARTVFTIFAKIGHVFGIGHVLPEKIQESAVFDSGMLQENYPDKNSFTGFLSGPLGNIGTKSGPIPRTGNVKKYYSGPLGKSITVSSSRTVNPGSFSGPIGKLTSKSGPLMRVAKTGLKWWRARDNSSKIHGKSLTPIHTSTNSGPFGGPMMGRNGSPVKTHHVNPTTATSDSTWWVQDIHGSKQKLFEAPPETLGGVALALHYANLIVVLEKLAASPHLIGHDARDDLYNMLPKNVKNALRVRLKPYAKSLASSPFDTGLAEEWTEAMMGILDWLSPLAHNTIRWQSERSFEHQNLVSRTNVVLVQTLHYANQEKVEATITELLVGLNYIWRFSREVNAKALLECENGVDEYVNLV
uniref:Protein CLASP-1 like n=1 Tax=Tanacetum cinerariifolium TaxID=118510 RepID=A0A6L2P477_TANCI|nr:protein CLASP-1 like [Tanacetum cinerariifolium]